MAYRSEAIENAFGDLSAALPNQVRVEFVRSKDPDHPLPSGTIAYDPEERVLFMSRKVLDAKLPNPLRWAASYWPFYEQQQARETFPVVEAIDDALWNAFLQAAATARGVGGGAVDCRSPYVEKRLPCEMVTSAIAHIVKTRRLPLFNENRIDRLWPEDFAGFVERNWRRESQSIGTWNATAACCWFGRSSVSLACRACWLIWRRRRFRSRRTTCVFRHSGTRNARAMHCALGAPIGSRVRPATARAVSR